MNFTQFHRISWWFLWNGFAAYIFGFWGFAFVTGTQDGTKTKKNSDNNIFHMRMRLPEGSAHHETKFCNIHPCLLFCCSTPTRRSLLFPAAWYQFNHSFPPSCEVTVASLLLQRCYKLLCSMHCKLALSNDSNWFCTMSLSEKFEVRPCCSLGTLHLSDPNKMILSDPKTMLP